MVKLGKSVIEAQMSNFRILCIEDNPDTQRMLTFILARSGYDVITADDGPQGIQKAKAWRPALIMVDMMMPKMSGADTIRELRKIDVIKEIPILVLSAYNEDALIDEALAAGADDYINKTVLPTDLTDIIDKCLEVGTAVLTKRASRIKTQENAEEKKDD
jgi:two-component system alkaline phosphatase synthesis response regulator PhoP